MKYDIIEIKGKEHPKTRVIGQTDDPKDVLKLRKLMKNESIVLRPVK